MLASRSTAPTLREKDPSYLVARCVNANICTLHSNACRAVPNGRQLLRSHDARFSSSTCYASNNHAQLMSTDIQELEFEEAMPNVRDSSRTVKNVNFTSEARLYQTPLGIFMWILVLGTVHFLRNFFFPAVETFRKVPSTVQPFLTLAIIIALARCCR